MNTTVPPQPDHATQSPAIVLIRPQLGENIGAAARVMANFGLSDLRIVAPRDGWPNDKALEMAAHATPLIESARVTETTAHALDDITYAVATTARMRELNKPACDSVAVMPKLAAHSKPAIVFGPERTGLTTEDLSLVDALVHIPVSDDYPSLNLAQAVAVMSYGWHIASSPNPAQNHPTQKAPKAELQNLFDHLDTQLDASGFYRVPEKRDAVRTKLHAMLSRPDWTSEELRLLRGMLNAFTK